IIAGIVTGEPFEGLRRLAPFCLFVRIKLTNRWSRRWCRWVLDRRVKFLYRLGKRSLRVSLTIIEIIAAGDVEQNDTCNDTNCDHERTTSLLKPVLSLFVEPDHRVVFEFHLLDGDLLLPSYRLCQNSEPPDRVQSQCPTKSYLSNCRGADAKNAPKI